MPGYSKNRIIPLVCPVCFLAIFLYLFSACASFLSKLYLIRDGRFRVEPFEIRKGKKGRTLSESFYPFISPWSSIYIFKFRKADQP